MVYIFNPNFWHENNEYGNVTIFYTSIDEILLMDYDNPKICILYDQTYYTWMQKRRENSWDHRFKIK